MFKENGLGAQLFYLEGGKDKDKFGLGVNLCFGGEGGW